RFRKKEISNMLWTIIVILFVLWLIGLLAHVGGGLIHLLLVVAVIVLIINLVTGRREGAKKALLSIDGFFVPLRLLRELLLRRRADVDVDLLVTAKPPPTEHE